MDVNLRLTQLICFDEGDGFGSAEPYLWTVFFKIDGDTASVNPGLALEGTATVVTTPGNHGSLPNHDVDPGERVAIPESIGAFRTQLKPIPLQQPVGNVTAIGGVVGAILVLMEEDETSDSAVAKGHRALNKAVLDALNALIPTLNILRPEPTSEDIAAMGQRIGDAVRNAIKDGVGIWGWLKAFGNMDDKIGDAVLRYSHAELERAGVGGIAINRHFPNEGEWAITGMVSALPVGVQTGSLKVMLSNLPSPLASTPVSVNGPGISMAINRSTTFNAVPVGVYTITPRAFSTGTPNKPNCRDFTPNTGAQQRTVSAGQTASVTVGFTSKRCDDTEP